jgi:hypothetical protein
MNTQQDNKVVLPKARDHSLFHHEIKKKRVKTAQKSIDDLKRPRKV